MSKDMNNRQKKLLDSKRWSNKRTNNYVKDSNNIFNSNNSVKKSRKNFNHMKHINKSMINHNLKSNNYNKRS